MMPLGLSGGAACSALGKSTCAADSIVTAVVTMKMISRTRKISVSGVILMSENTPPPLLEVIAIGKHLYARRPSALDYCATRSSSCTRVIGHYRTRGPFNSDCDWGGACRPGGVQNPYH